MRIKQPFSKLEGTYTAPDCVMYGLNYLDNIKLGSAYECGLLEDLQQLEYNAFIKIVTVVPILGAWAVVLLIGLICMCKLSCRNSAQTKEIKKNIKSMTNKVASFDNEVISVSHTMPIDDQSGIDKTLTKKL